MTTEVCRLHYRAAAAHCADCGRGMCSACGSAAGLCPVCALRLEEAEALVRERRRSRMALRRAGIALRVEPGDPVVLREGPLRLVIPLVGGACVAVAAAALCAEVEVRLGVAAALPALLCAVLIGPCVRALLGGVSRTAGVIAAALCLTAAVAGSWWAGDAVRRGDAGPAIDGLSSWVLAHGAVAPALYAVAALLAYGAAAGHRVA